MPNGWSHSTPAIAEQADENSISIDTIVAAFRRHLKLFVIVLAATFGAAAILTLQQTPKYTASARIVIDQRKRDIVKDQAVVSDLPADSATVDTETEILRSRSLAEKVAELTNRFDSTNARAPHPSFLRSIIDQVAPGILKKPDQRLVRERIVDDLLGSLDVARVGDTFMIEVSYSATDPETAADTANAFAKAYIDDQLNAKYSLTQQASEWLNSKLVVLRKQADEADAAVQSYKAAHNLISAQGSTIAEQEVSGLDQQLAIARADQAEKEARLSTARAQLKRGSTGEDVGAALDSPVIQQLRQQRAGVSQKVADLEGRYGERHPDLLKARRELVDIDTQIHSEIGRIISNLEAQVQVARQHTGSLMGSLNQTKSQLSGNATASVRLNELQRNADSASAIYQSFLDRYKQASTQVGMQSSDARIVSAAKLPTGPSSPKVMLNLLLGLIVGTLLGVGSVVVAELLFTGFSSIDDMEQYLGLQTLTSIADLGTVGASGRDGAEIVSPEKFVVQHPMSSFSESFRSLRASLRLCRAGQKTRLIAITSSVVNEGKSSISIALTRVSALAGDRVILVDCDLRHRGVNRVLAESRNVGLIEVLSGAAPLTDAIVRDTETTAHLLPIGNTPYSPRDILASEAMQQLLNQLSRAYELVILDAPPVLAVSDVRGFANMLDAIVMVAKWGKTPRKVVANALRTLSASGGYVAGIVLNCVDLRQAAHFGAHYSSYYTGGYDDAYGYTSDSSNPENK
jgi:exopolysaccharide transport family protein